ncbi:hypothetical protein BDN70DRAFT_811426 [Pholiota conissans]|uniref:Uncharacterized protein n=1 Tax=Pholiota conissans TaxID=109636 RepID=A0A9P6CS52_9AGAR|nr:hypothetical protein BDN70DRAFT_811426 [Pholiota conissans]
MRRFEDAFVRTLKLICTWLQTPSRDDAAADTDDKSSNKMHASVPRLFMGSMLLEVIHVFLSNANIQDLVAHSEAYTASLELLKQMLDASSSSSSSSWEDSITLATILRQPMRRIESSSGLRRAVWGDASVRYEDLGLSTTAGGRSVPNSTATVPINRRSLCDLVADLSTQQKHLLQLAEKATFPPTVEKVNALYDGIARVMFQNFLED